jgi:hypothetical protein
MNGAVWSVKLRGLHGKPTLVWSSKTYGAWQAKKQIAQYTDPVTTETFKGVLLKDLVGRIDGGSKTAFNEQLATTAPGYVVRVAGVDGFFYDFPSADVAAKSIIVADRFTVTGASGDVQLPYGTAKYKTTGNKASFSPSWPLKLVGSDLASGTQKIGGINYITIVNTPVK